MMNPRESFTLCPSSIAKAPSNSNEKSGGNANNASTRSRVIKGTIRQDWKTDNDRRSFVCPEVGSGVRIAPFELSVSDRNLLGGTITPLGSLEYQSWVHSRQQQQGNLPFDDSFRGDVEEENGNENWKLRYLHSEMARRQSQATINYLLEERRRMQSQMMALETQLYESRMATGNQLHLPFLNDDIEDFDELDEMSSKDDEDDDTPLHKNRSPDKRDAPPLETISIRIGQGDLPGNESKQKGNADNGSTFSVDSSRNTDAAATGGTLASASAAREELMETPTRRSKRHRTTNIESESNDAEYSSPKKRRTPSSAS